jgi:serine/threonine protein kinase
MDSCKCPITGEIFEDPVVGDDGHTYERKVIINWLTKNQTSPLTGQPMNISSLRTNYTVKKMIEELKSIEQLQQTQYQFQLDVEIRKIRPRPLFQGFGKSIYEVEWINRDGPPIILLKIDGAKAKREASFYVQLSCHPHIVRTFGIVQSNPGSIMLLQESAPHGDLSELLRENGFKPNEAVLCEIFKQICDAMICLADNGIVHGDLACRNVLVFSSNSVEPKVNLVKLTDFGLTRESKLYTMVDSPVLTTMTIIPVRYAAPEILKNPNKLSYTEKSDIYSMGVLMWEACSYGQLPYSSLDSDEAVRKSKLNDQRLPQPSLCSHQLWTIINECWQQESLNRPTFKTLKESLSTLETKSKFEYVKISYVFHH